MSFTYYEDPDNPQDRDYVRFFVGDKVKDEGPFPEGKNFSDHELDIILDVAGTWQRAVVACLEALEAAWIPNPSWMADSMSVSFSHISKNYGDAAARARKRYGITYGEGGFARGVIKVDGYSQDIATTTVS